MPKKKKYMSNTLTQRQVNIIYSHIKRTLPHRGEKPECQADHIYPPGAKVENE
jgi:hypothetical protein